MTGVQTCALPISSAEAEYRAVANGVAEASWLRQLLAELHSPLTKSTLVYCDNVSAVYFSTNPVQHQRTKDVEIDLYFIHDRVAIGLHFVRDRVATFATAGGCWCICEWPIWLVC